MCRECDEGRPDLARHGERPVADANGWALSNAAACGAKWSGMRCVRPVDHAGNHWYERPEVGTE